MMGIYRKATMTPAERKAMEAMQATIASQQAIINELVGTSTSDDPDAEPQTPQIISRVAAVETAVDQQQQIIDTMLTGGDS